MAKRTWSDVGKTASDAGQGFVDAVKSTWEGIWNVTVGAGGTANNAAGGIAGKLNGLLKFITASGLTIVNKGFDIVKARPNLAAVAVITATGLGIYKFFQRKKVTSLQEIEIEGLQQRATVANNYLAQRQAAASGFDNAMASDTNAARVRQQQMATSPVRA